MIKGILLGVLIGPPIVAAIVVIVQVLWYVPGHVISLLYSGSMAF